MKQTAMPPFPWQSQAWQGIFENRKAGRLPHAILLHGVDGLGIIELSQALSQYLLCQTPLEDVACGRCKGCQLSLAETHPDYFLLKREESTQIKVDQVRGCVDFVAKTPHFNHSKVVVVEEADLLNINAANALLKSLEEPQGNTIFVLVTTSVSSVLPTIRSRCQAVKISVPPENEANSWLEHVNVKASLELLKLAGGAPLKVKEWIESDFTADMGNISRDLHELIMGISSVTSLANSWQKYELSKLLEGQLLVLDMLIKKSFDLSVPISKEFGELAEISAFAPSELYLMRDRVLTKIEQGRSLSNLNPGLLCEELAIDWASFSQVVRRRMRKTM